MNKSSQNSSQWETDNIKRSVHLMGWTGFWLVTTAIAAFGPKLIWDYATLPTIFAVLANLGVGYGMIMANIRVLKGLDELQRKIFLDSATFTLGVGLVLGINYELLEDIRLIEFQPEISHLIIVMGLTFLVSIITRHRRYK